MNSVVVLPSDLLDAARQLAAPLMAHGALVATAESCTGGLIAATLTELAGSSQWFERGFVTYSNASKHELLGVPADTLDAHGAVSEPVARAMAEGALRRSRARLALAVTGVAGPGGGSAGKPVGTVCFGWAIGPGGSGPGAVQRVVVETRHFNGARDAVRAQTALHALLRAREIFSATFASAAQASA
ncbi:MAG: CinA family protein [Betaproteobacteria bacterium]|nr:CinA family protein [Betaproteobacteria bacterium]